VQRVHLLINSGWHEWGKRSSPLARDWVPYPSLVSEENLVWWGELTTVCLQCRRLRLMLGGAKKYLY